MKKLLLFLSIFFISFRFVHSQDSIKLNGKNYKMELVDSSKFSINGWWRLIDIQYLRDDGTQDVERKWDKQQFGDMANFSNQVLTLYSANLMGIGLVDPLYMLSYEDSVQAMDGFNERFLNKLLFVSVFLKDVEGPYFVNYILNPNLMVVFGNNQAIYYERILDKRKINYNGWKQENGWNIVKYKGWIGSFNTFIDSVVVNNPAYELEYVFTPQPSCPLDTSFYQSDFIISCYENLNTKAYTNVAYLRRKNYLPVTGKISGDKLKNNLIRFFLATCDAENPWIMRWRVKRKEGK